MSSTSRPPAARPRVGHIAFLNCLPLYWGLERSGGREGFELVRDTPDRLSDALVAGELDAGPISLAEYLRHPEELLVLPDLAVGSDGPVMSVNLVSRVPLAELDDRPVALGSTSRTSVVLARLLLTERVGVRPRWLSRPPDLPAMLDEADAAVLIGDAALAAALRPLPEPGLEVHDLAAAWRDWTGLPMVFAVWAVRAEWWHRDPDGVRDLHRRFVAGRDLALAHVPEIAARGAEQSSFEADELAAYFDTLDFTLGARQLAGAAEYAWRAAGILGLTHDAALCLLDVT